MKNVALSAYIARAARLNRLVSAYETATDAADRARLGVLILEVSAKL